MQKGNDEEKMVIIAEKLTFLSSKAPKEEE